MASSLVRRLFFCLLLIFIARGNTARAQSQSIPNDPSAFAQSTANEWALQDNFAVRNWTRRDGLPQISVTGIEQTEDGYLWLGTFGGLARFDGLKFTTYDITSRPDLGSDRISTLTSDPSGRLWIGHENGQITTFLNGKLSTIFTPPEPNLIIQISMDSKGGIYAATPNGLIHIDGAGMRTYTWQDGLPGGEVMETISVNDTLCIATQNGLV